MYKAVFYLFLSEGMDKHASETLIITNTDVFRTVCVKVLVCLNFLKTFSTFVCLAYSAMSFIYF